MCNLLLPMRHHRVPSTQKRASLIQPEINVNRCKRDNCSNAPHRNEMLFFRSPTLCVGPDSKQSWDETSMKRTCLVLVPTALGVAVGSLPCAQDSWSDPSFLYIIIYICNAGVQSGFNHSIRGIPGNEGGFQWKCFQQWKEKSHAK